MRLFLAGRFHRRGGAWEVLGIYSSPQGAALRCTREKDFYMVFELNTPEPEEPREDDGAVYPNRLHHQARHDGWVKQYA